MNQIMFKDPMPKPHSGWGVTVKGYRFWRPTRQALIEAVEDFLESEGEESRDLEHRIDAEFCQNNPENCFGCAVPEDKEQAQANAAAKEPPKDRFAAWIQWVRRSTREMVNALEANRRADICAACEHNSFRVKKALAYDMIILTNNRPIGRCGHCTWYDHDNQIAVWNGALRGDKEHPTGRCWVE